MATRRIPRLLTATLLAAATGVAAQELPRLSPRATVFQTLGVTRVEVAYCRPAVRDRTVWGELVPWGEVWRTGANEATRISFSHDVKVDGRPLAAGEYALFTIPRESEWTVIFNREADQWGAFEYDPEQDALRIPVKPREAPFLERFQIDFPEVGTDTALVSLRWAELQIPFTVQVDLEATTAAAARAFVAAAGPADGQAVWRWTDHLYRRGWNLEEALEWATTLADQAPMYWTHALRARLLAATGEPARAIEVARTALERAAAEAEQPGVTADAEILAGEVVAWEAGNDEPGQSASESPSSFR